MLAVATVVLDVTGVGALVIGGGGASVIKLSMSVKMSLLCQL